MKCPDILEIKPFASLFKKNIYIIDLRVLFLKNMHFNDQHVICFCLSVSSFCFLTSIFLFI